MAFGLPVITTNVGGLKYFFKEDMGYTSTPKNVDDLIKKLKLLLLEPEKMNQIGKFNFDYAQQNLASDIVSKRLYNWLTEK
jgi:glycosyltransferase involved in cell wall biosynthesis